MRERIIQFNAIFNIPTFVICCVATVVMFHVLGKPELSGEWWQNFLVPKLIFEQSKAVELFGDEKAQEYLDFRVFSFFVGNGLVIAFLAFTLMMSLVGFRLEDGVFDHRLPSPSYAKLILVMFATTLFLFLINWVLPTPLGQVGEGGKYRIRPTLSSQLVMSTAIGLYVMGCTMLWATIFEWKRKKRAVTE